MFILVRRFYSPDNQDKGNNQDNKETQTSETKPEETDKVALAKAYKDLKDNSVSKEEYEKLQKENQELIDQVINGGGNGGNGQQETPPEQVDIEALRKELYGPTGENLTNLEFWKKTLQLRDAVIARDGIDPFLPHGANIKPTDFDAERANAVAKVVKECIDEADGDSGVFTALLQSKINNDSQAFTAHLKKIGAYK